MKRYRWLSVLAVLILIFTASVAAAQRHTIRLTDDCFEDRDPLNTEQRDGCTVSAADLVDLPETGQQTVYHSGDDGHLRAGVAWPMPRFSDNSDGTVTDNLTGLMWLKDANCAHTSGHDPDNTGDGSLSWSESLLFVAGINDGSHDISACAAYSRDYTDWRMANINEIESLTNAGVPDSAAWLNTLQPFENVQTGFYWSSTTLIYGPNRAWRLDMRDGLVDHHSTKNVPYYAWPVRAGQKDEPDPTYPANVWQTGQTASYLQGDDGDLKMGIELPDPRFKDTGNGTVIDSLTGLTWLKDLSCLGKANWSDAFAIVADFNANPGNYLCENYTADHDDWRIPNRKELLSLIDRSQYNPSLASGHPFVNYEIYDPCGSHWSATTYASDESVAWSVCVYFATMAAVGKIGETCIFPVRGGQFGCPGDLDGDLDTDGDDLAAFTEEMGRTDCDDANPCDGDLDNDGDVDEEDLMAFADCYGRSDL